MKFLALILYLILIVCGFLAAQLASFVGYGDEVAGFFSRLIEKVCNTFEI